MNISDEKIEALRSEAGEHGDLDMVEICDNALGGDEHALRECQRVLDDAAAMADDGTVDITLRVAAFAGEGERKNKIRVDIDGNIRVWDDVAGHYTVCHSIDESDQGRILVRATRMRRELSVEELAEKCGVSPRTVENWEQGRNSPGGAARKLLLAL